MVSHANARFVHLNLHTEYSIVDGIVRIDELLPACVAAKMPAVAITDQSNLFSLVKFYKTAIAAGIKPIIGVDIWLDNENDAAQPHKAILLAQNRVGYRNVIQLISNSYICGQKLGRPIVKRAWLEEFSAGVIALSGAGHGEIGKALLQRDESAFITALKWWQKFFPERFYIELQRTGQRDEEAYIAAAVEAAVVHDLPLVATNAVCFLNQDDFDAHEARVCIHAGYVLEDRKRPRLYTEQQYLRTPQQMAKLFADIPTALANTVEIAKRCNVEIKLGENFLPIYPVPENMDVAKYLEDEAQEGLMKRLDQDGHGNAVAAVRRQPKNLDNVADNTTLNTKTAAPPLLALEQYQKRLQYELGVITQMGFPSYFLIVADFIRWAKNNGVPVGPGRGSGAGSLVAYALGITDLDPLAHDLLFERFLNPERISLPDFDVDFCMEGRDRVIEYVVHKYGRDKVAQIITYGTMAARAVVRDVGRVLGHPYGFVDTLAKLIPFELGISLDKALEDEELLRKRYDEEDEVKVLIDLAKKLEGLVRNAGKHAGGVVIAPSQLTDFTPLYCEEGDVPGRIGASNAITKAGINSNTNGSTGAVVTQLDKDDVEAVGLVKFDFLGLRTLTIINWAMQTINAQRVTQHLPPLDISQIPLDDAASYKLLQECKTVAIFQLESRGIRDLVKKLKPDCFSEVVALVALYRPGPLQSGMVDDFLNRKHGRERVTYLHAALEPILRDTYGVILYQEQVMQIAQVLSGYSLGGADILRRAMGKKKPEEMAKQRAIFLDGAAGRGIDKHVANTIFDLIEKFAGYGFNKSHSAAYALIAYQTAWLKAHYPAEFMAAVLSSDMDNTDKVVLFLNECKELGLEVEPPDINAGQYKFTVKNVAVNPGEGDGGDTAVVKVDAAAAAVQHKKIIVYGLGAVKGVGQIAIENICQRRNSGDNGTAPQPFSDLFDFCQRVDLRKVNKRVFEALIYAGAFDKIAPNRASLFASLPLALQQAELIERSKTTGQLDMFAMMDAEVDSDNGNGGSGALSVTQDEHDICARATSHGNYTVVNEWDVAEKLKAEKHVLGYYLSGHPIAQYQEELRKLGVTNRVNLKAESGAVVLVAGFVIASKTFNTRNGKRLVVVTIEDQTGTIELTVFSELYMTAREYLQEGRLVIAEVEVSVDNFTGGERARATNVRNLEQTRTVYAKCLLLRLNDEVVNDVLLKNIEQALAENLGGPCPVYISYTQKNIEAGEKVNLPIKLNPKWQVNLQDKLMQRLHEILGKESVEIFLK
jgi:DNA polymerase III subunit alpha